MVAHLGGADGGGFVGGNNFSAPGARQADAAHGAGVNNAAAARAGGGFDDVAGAFDIGGIHRGVIAQPKVIAGRDVETPVAAQHGFLQGAAGEVPGNGLIIRALEAAKFAVWAQQCFDTMAAGGQFLHQIGSNKTGGACDKTNHCLKQQVVLKSGKGNLSFRAELAPCRASDKV